MKQKICFVFGTRPEAIKLAPVIHQCYRDSLIEPVIITTGQHQEMLVQMLELFEIKPDFALNVSRKNQSLSKLSSNLFKQLDPIIDSIHPDMILVQGDTTSAMVAAMISFYHQIPVGHIEAGLRSHYKNLPFPEEMNRRIVSLIANWHFTPTKTATDNLIKEHYPADTLFQVGNPVVDAMQWILRNKKCESDNEWHQLSKKYRMILLTTHRRESFGSKMEEIFKAILHIADTHPQVKIIYPVHLNPNVKKLAYQMLEKHASIQLIPPQSYLDFLTIMKHSTLIVTDSGGVQEEAPLLGKPVLVLRDVTERTEGVECGIAKLIGQNPDRLIEETSYYLKQCNQKPMQGKTPNLYGDGKASERIVKILCKDFKEKNSSSKLFEKS